MFQIIKRNKIKLKLLKVIYQPIHIFKPTNSSFLSSSLSSSSSSFSSTSFPSILTITTTNNYNNNNISSSSSSSPLVTTTITTTRTTTRSLYTSNHILEDPFININKNDLLKLTDEEIQLLSTTDIISLLFHTSRNKLRLSSNQLNSVTNNLKNSLTPLTSHYVSNLLYGLRPYNTSMDVDSLLEIIAKKLQNSEGKLRAQHVSNVMYGLHGFSSNNTAVRKLLIVLGDKIETCDEVLNGQEFSTCYYGLRDLRSSEKEVRSLLKILYLKLEKTTEPLTSEGLGVSLFGLRYMSSKYPEVLSLIRLLNNKLSDTNIMLDSYAIGCCLHGLQSMTSDTNETKLLLKLLTELIKKSDAKLDSKAIGTGLYGFRLLSDDSKEVLDLLNAVTSKIQKHSTPMKLNERCVSSSLHGLQSMSSKSLEVKNLINIFNQQLLSSSTLSKLTNSTIPISSSLSSPINTKISKEFFFDKSEQGEPFRLIGLLTLCPFFKNKFNNEVEIKNLLKGFLFQFQKTLAVNSNLFDTIPPNEYFQEAFIERLMSVSTTNNSSIQVSSEELRLLFKCFDSTLVEHDSDVIFLIQLMNYLFINLKTEINVHEIKSIYSFIDSNNLYHLPQTKQLFQTLTDKMNGMTKCSFNDYLSLVSLFSSLPSNVYESEKYQLLKKTSEFALQNLISSGSSSSTLVSFERLSEFTHFFQQLDNISDGGILATTNLQIFEHLLTTHPQHLFDYVQLSQVLYNFQKFSYVNVILPNNNNNNSNPFSNSLSNCLKLLSSRIKKDSGNNPTVLNFAEVIFALRNIVDIPYCNENSLSNDSGPVYDIFHLYLSKLNELNLKIDQKNRKKLYEICQYLNSFFFSQFLLHTYTPPSSLLSSTPSTLSSTLSTSSSSSQVNLLRLFQTLPKESFSPSLFSSFESHNNLTYLTQLISSKLQLLLNPSLSSSSKIQPYVQLSSRYLPSVAHIYTFFTIYLNSRLLPNHLTNISLSSNDALLFYPPYQLIPSTIIQKIQPKLLTSIENNPNYQKFYQKIQPDQIYKLTIEFNHYFDCKYSHITIGYSLKQKKQVACTIDYPLISIELQTPKFKKLNGEQKLESQQLQISSLSNNNEKNSSLYISDELTESIDSYLTLKYHLHQVYRYRCEYNQETDDEEYNKLQQIVQNCMNSFFHDFLKLKSENNSIKQSETSKKKKKRKGSKNKSKSSQNSNQEIKTETTPKTSSSPLSSPLPSISKTN